MITLVGSEKGGTGKTTISVNLAILIAQNGEDVLLIDTDKQPSASYFFQVRDDNQIKPRVTCIQKFGKNLPRDVLDLSQRYSQIIIDAGGRDSAELRYSLGIADHIIIPLRPTQLDTWTLDQMNKIILQARTFNPDLMASVVLNMVSTNIANTDVEETVSLIGEYHELDIFNVRIKERVAFQRSVREGQTVCEHTPKDVKAQNEIKALYKEAFKNGQRKKGSNEASTQKGY